MRPARDRRIRRLAAGALLSGAAAAAAAAPCLAAESFEGLLKCRGLADAAARLACFDREAAALTVAPAAPRPAPQGSGTPGPPVSAAAPLRTAPVLDPQQQFGLSERGVAAKEVAAGTRAADAPKIEAHLVRIASAADGRSVLTLDNGQVWRQVGVEGDLLFKPGDALTISRGLLGSYWLQVQAGRGCKVRRLR